MTHGDRMKRVFFALACLVCAFPPAHAAEPGRCAPLDFASDGEFRNVTEPGDVRIVPTDKTVLINKRKPEATRVIFGAATSKHSPVVIVKDCSGTAYTFVLTISGVIDAGEVTIDGNYGSQAFGRIGDGWMTQ
jgi:hypothetical protein